MPYETILRFKCNLEQIPFVRKPAAKSAKARCGAVAEGLQLAAVAKHPIGRLPLYGGVTVRYIPYLGRRKFADVCQLGL